jgi:oligosaccharide repeat unit polymerase
VNWLTAAVFLLVPAIAWTARRTGGSWYSPAAFFGAFWCVFGGLPLVAGPISIQPGGMLFVAASCGAVLLGAGLAQRWRRTVPPASQPPLAEPPGLEWFIGLCIVLGAAVVAIIVISFWREGIPPGLNIVQVIHRLAIERTAGPWQEPALARVLTAAPYLGAMLAGVMLAIRNTATTRWLALGALVPSVAITVLLTTKSSLLLPLALGASAYFATCVAAGRPATLTMRRAGIVAGIVVAIGTAFVLVQMIRYAGWAIGQPLAVVRLLWFDTFPYMGAFSTWFAKGALSTSLHPAFGQYTFAGFFDLLHVHTRIAGLYTDQVVVNGTGYNIYTVFRGLIEDFTVGGALLFLVVVGFGAELAYRRVQSGDFAFVGVLAAFYAATLWSFVVDIFIYNTIVLAVVVLIGYLWIAPRSSIWSAVRGRTRAASEARWPVSSTRTPPMR